MSKDDLTQEAWDEDLGARETYLGNKNLRKPGVKVRMTDQRYMELAKCKNDIEYFARNYIKIVHVDKGFVPFEPYDYQTEIMQKQVETRNVIILTGRQQGKCHTKDTEITIRCKKTGKVRKISVGEFHDAVVMKTELD